jgi:hypothetical protein
MFRPNFIYDGFLDRERIKTSGEVGNYLFSHVELILITTMKSRVIKFTTAFREIRMMIKLYLTNQLSLN